MILSEGVIRNMSRGGGGGVAIILICRVLVLFPDLHTSRLMHCDKAAMVELYVWPPT